MSEVVEFQAKPKEDLTKVIWTCNCGCTTFRLRADSYAACAGCDNVANGYPENWRRLLPDLPQEVEDVSPGMGAITDLGSAEMAIRRVLKKVDPNEMRVLAVVNDDGSLLSVWSGDFDTDERKEWINRKLDELRVILLR